MVVVMEHLDHLEHLELLVRQTRGVVLVVLVAHQEILADLVLLFLDTPRN